MGANANPNPASIIANRALMAGCWAGLFPIVPKFGWIIAKIGLDDPLHYAYRRMVKKTMRRE
jgi:hypothetical protein